MRVRRKPFVLMVAVAALAVLVVAQPIAAYTELKTKGTVGAHSLTDTASSPGADCIYRYRSDWDLWKIKRINVDAPNVRAVPGQGDQMVGWSFTIQRQTYSAFADHPGPWENRYTSEVFTAVTDSAHDAAFSQQGVRVRIPVEPGSDVAFAYRAKVKAIWYRQNGRVMGTATMRVDWYDSVKGNDSETQHRACADYLV